MSNIWIWNRLLSGHLALFKVSLGKRISSQFWIQCRFQTESCGRSPSCLMQARKKRDDLKKATMFHFEIAEERSSGFSTWMKNIPTAKKIFLKKYSARLTSLILGFLP